MKLLRSAGVVAIFSLLSLSLIAGCGKGDDVPVTTRGSNAPVTGDNDSTTAGDVMVDGETASSKTRNLEPVSTPAAEAAVVSAVNGLGRELLIREDSGNTVVSPFSASKTLALLRVGAAGPTRDGISAAMSLSGAAAGVDAAFNALDIVISGRSGGMSTSVSGWTQSSYGYRLGYLDLLAENYGLITQPTNFASATGAAAGAVNGWEQQAAELPSNVGVSADTRLVLGGAVKLDTAWEDPFDPAALETGSFQLLSEQTVQVTFLRKKALIDQAGGDGYLAFGLPLRGGEQFLVVLPDQGKFREVEAALTPERWQQIAASLVPAQADLALPLFSIQGYVQPEVGMAQSRSLADFSALDGSHDLFVSMASHSSNLAVDAAGVKARSLTLIALEDAHPESWTGTYGAIFTSGWTSPWSEPTTALGRPFLFAVRDKVSGTFLFLGRVLDPRP